MSGGALLARFFVLGFIWVPFDFFAMAG